jgi:hypothetical protein
MMDNRATLRLGLGVARVHWLFVVRHDLFCRQLGTTCMANNDESNSSSPFSFVFALGRFVGFGLLAVPALLIVASVVLLPAYQSMLNTQHQRDCVRADNDAIKAYIAQTERLIRQAPEDEQLTKRLRMAYDRVAAPNEVTVEDPSLPPSVPGVVRVIRGKKSPAPSGLLVSMAGKVQDPSTRRGLFLLAGLAMLGAIFLFAPADKYKQDPNRA